MSDQNPYHALVADYYAEEERLRELNRQVDILLGKLVDACLATDVALAEWMKNPSNADAKLRLQAAQRERSASFSALRAARIELHHLRVERAVPGAISRRHRQSCHLLRPCVRRAS